MRSTALITPIILAAGDSTRMGYPKALLPLGHDTFLTRILRSAGEAGLAKPVVILGRAAGLVRPHIREWRGTVRVNPDPDRGQLSSLQLGLLSLDANAEAGMIWPVDQPAVSVDLVRRLASLFERSEALIVYPKHANRRGHPAIFHRDLFQEFMDAPLEEGPKNILLRHQQETVVLPTDEPAVIQDIDTPSDYKTLTGESLDLALARRDAEITLES